MTLDEFQTLAVSVPYVPGGRDFDGWDCWGLVYVAYREVFGITISRYDEYDHKLGYAEVEKLVNVEKAEWISVLRPRPGDLGLFRIAKHESHVSIIVANGRMLHCESQVGTVSEPLSGAIWGRRNVGYWRHGSIASAGNRGDAPA